MGVDHCVVVLLSPSIRSRARPIGWKMNGSTYRRDISCVRFRTFKRDPSLSLCNFIPCQTPSLIFFSAPDTPTHTSFSLFPGPVSPQTPCFGLSSPPFFYPRFLKPRDREICSFLSKILLRACRCFNGPGLSFIAKNCSSLGTLSIEFCLILSPLVSLANA